MVCAQSLATRETRSSTVRAQDASTRQALVARNRERSNGIGMARSVSIRASRPARLEGACRETGPGRNAALSAKNDPAPPAGKTGRGRSFRVGPAEKNDSDPGSVRDIAGMADTLEAALAAVH